jgi:hypothetical protein
MTAQRKFETNVTPTTTDMFDGEHVEMFSSGSAPCMSGGDVTGLFSSGSAPKTIAQSGAGEAVEMFSSGSTPTTSSTVIGDLTALFSSGS